MTTLTAGQTTYTQLNNGTYQETCNRCSGTGIYWLKDALSRPYPGECYKCGGAKTLGPTYTANQIHTMAERRAKAQTRRDAKRQTQWENNAATRQAQQLAEQTRQTEIQNEKAKWEWLDGEIGETQKLTITIDRNITVESQYGTSNLLLATIDPTHKIKIFTAANWSNNAEPGETYTITAKIKSHDEYQGEKITQLTRPTIN